MNQWSIRHSGMMMRALGLKSGGHLPAAGMPERLIENIRVYVLPAPGADPTCRHKSSKHRVMAVCPVCDRHMSAGRLFAQHARVHGG